MRHDTYFSGIALDRAEALHLRYAGARPEAVISAALQEFPGEVAMVSSFGADSVVLLHMLAQVDRSIPVLMIDTLMLFPETIAYQEELAERFGLTDVRRLRPDPADLAEQDPDGLLHLRNPDACCAIRKVAPLQPALREWPVMIDGRKRHQTTQRSRLRLFETVDEGRIKVSPLAGWTGTELRAYRDRHALPPHPLVAKGFRSIGCAPCTTPVAEGEDERAGRWRGSAKVECGIHFGPDGRITRAGAGVGVAVN